MNPIAVMGAGAVGCYYGGLLARAGREVTLIGRDALVEAVRHAGLRLEAATFDARVPIQASTEAEGARGARLILFSVKSQDTEAAGRALAPHLERDAAIVTLQNGVDNAERLAAVLGREVTPAAVYVAVGMAEPGHVRHHGRGELVIGRTGASEALVAEFAAAGVPAEISDDVNALLWEKLVINCAYNALSAITQLPYGRLVQCEGIPGVMRDVVDECTRVAQAAGVRVREDMPQAVERIAQTMSGQLSSTARDLARGRKSEIDHLNGAVVQKGEALGIATPANRLLLALVKRLEGRSAS